MAQKYMLKQDIVYRKEKRTPQYQNNGNEVSFACGQMTEFDANRFGLAEIN